ncbi:MAG: hypothetical protein ABSE62_01825 [Chthoniobacteraceae bacterium]
MTVMPAAGGWHVGGIVDGESGRHAPTMEEVAQTVPDDAEVRLSLPVSAVLLERMRLPSTDRGELDGMVILQLEKTLPYSGEELTSGYDIIRQGENESDLLAIAVSNEQLDTLCQPLRTRRKLPALVTIYAIQLAAKFPAEEVLALVFREAESTILAIVQKGKLVAAHACLATDRDTFLGELPRILLAAELEGAPVNFTKVVIEPGLASWRDGLREHFGKVPVELAPMDGPLEQGPVNLVPAGWTLEQADLARKARIRDWLVLGGAIYLALLLLAAGYIIWLQRRVSAIDGQVAATTPAVDAIANQKTRWTALAPAADPTRYTVEILQQTDKSIPSPDLHVTIFEHYPGGFMVEGEAPTAAMAIQYVDALRSNPDLSDYHFDSAPPEILPNEHAHFRIFAKL